jgi:hypothetical protein
VTYCKSHKLHVTRHTSHVTRHTSHVTCTVKMPFLGGSTVHDMGNSNLFDV